MRTITRTMTAIAWGSLFACAQALAHGDEDHGAAAPAPIAGTVDDQLTTHGTTPQFELLLKYPHPHVDEPAQLRFFLAEYATNRPVEGATFVLSSKPSGVVSKAPPRMTAPGIYDVTVTFPADTVYQLTATIAVGSRSDVVNLQNVYTGEAAERFLAEHGSVDVESTGMGWWVWPLIVVGGALLVTIVALLVRRGRGRERRKEKDETSRREVRTGEPDESTRTDDRKEEE